MKTVVIILIILFILFLLSNQPTVETYHSLIATSPFIPLQDFSHADTVRIAYPSSLS